MAVASNDSEENNIVNLNVASQPTPVYLEHQLYNEHYQDVDDKFEEGYGQFNDEENTFI